MAILTQEVQVISPVSTAINDDAYADDRLVSIRQNGTVALTLRMPRLEPVKGGAPVTFKHLSGRQKWFEVATTHPMALSINSNAEGFTVRGSDGRDRKLSGPHQLRTTASAVRFGLAEGSLSYPSFAVSKLSFVDFDQFSADDIGSNGLKSGSIKFEDAYNKERTLNEGDIVEIGPINNGRMNTLRMSEEGLRIVFSGNVGALKIKRGDVEKDFMPKFINVVMPDSSALELASLLVAVVTALVAFITFLKGATTASGRRT